MKKYLLPISLVIMCILPFFPIYADTPASNVSISTYYPTEGTYSLSSSAIPDIELDDLFIYEKISGWYYIEYLPSQLFENSDVPQLFKFLHAGENTFYIKTKSDTFLTLSDSSTSSDVSIYLSAFSKEDNQKWTLNLLKHQYEEIPIADGIYSISTADENEYTVTIKNNSNLIDQPIHFAKVSKSNPPTYELKQQPDGWYTIKSTSSNLFWDVILITDKFYLRQWAGTGGNNQKFKFIDAKDNTYYIVSKYHLSLDAYSSKTKDQISLTSYRKR